MFSIFQQYLIQAPGSLGVATMSPRRSSGLPRVGRTKGFDVACWQQRNSPRGGSSLLSRHSQRETQTERDTDRERRRQRETQTERDTNRERHKQRETHSVASRRLAIQTRAEHATDFTMTAHRRLILSMNLKRKITNKVPHWAAIPCTPLQILIYFLRKIDSTRETTVHHVFT